jgi:hypothetical protein
MFNDYDFMMGLTDYSLVGVLLSLGTIWLIGVIAFRDK